MLLRILLSSLFFFVDVEEVEDFLLEVLLVILVVELDVLEMVLDDFVEVTTGEM